MSGGVLACTAGMGDFFSASQAIEARAALNRPMPGGRNQGKLRCPFQQHQAAVLLATQLLAYDMLERTTAHIGHTVAHRLQCQAAASAIGEPDIQPFIAKEPQAQGHGKRKVVEAGLPRPRQWAPAWLLPTVTAPPARLERPGQPMPTSRAGKTDDE